MILLRTLWRGLHYLLVYTAEDVALAIQHGVNGVVISNHGGRQLDGVPATLDALRECAPVAKGKIAIAIDGGIRRGTDIFKALALGADYCFAGRIPIWGLAVSLISSFHDPFLTLNLLVQWNKGRGTCCQAIARRI